MNKYATKPPVIVPAHLLDCLMVPPTWWDQSPVYIRFDDPGGPVELEVDAGFVASVAMRLLNPNLRRRVRT
jgi:hypothetical protein